MEVEYGYLSYNLDFPIEYINQGCNLVNSFPFVHTWHLINIRSRKINSKLKLNYWTKTCNFDHQVELNRPKTNKIFLNWTEYCFLIYTLRDWIFRGVYFLSDWTNVASSISSCSEAKKERGCNFLVILSSFINGASTYVNYLSMLRMTVLRCYLSIKFYMLANSSLHDERNKSLVMRSGYWMLSK